MIELSVIGSDSSVNHPTRSKFRMGEDAGLNALKVSMRRTSIRSWLDICLNYERVRKWPQ